MRGRDPAQRSRGISEREGQLQRERVKHSERDGDFREGMETQEEHRGLQRGGGNLGGGWGLQGGDGDLIKELQRRGRGFREQLQGRMGASKRG